MPTPLSVSTTLFDLFSYWFFLGDQQRGTFVNDSRTVVVDPTDEDDSLSSTDPDGFDPTSVEPDTFDPESVESPIDIPEAPNPSDNDVSPELRRTFWLIVLMVNIGLFTLSVGVMVVVFWGQLRFGGSLVVLGVFALAVGYIRYRHHRNR